MSLKSCGQTQKMMIIIIITPKSSDIEVFDDFAMDYHVALFLNFDEMIIPK